MKGDLELLPCQPGTISGNSTIAGPTERICLVGCRSNLAVSTACLCVTGMNMVKHAGSSRIGEVHTESCCCFTGIPHRTIQLLPLIRTVV